MCEQHLNMLDKVDKFFVKQFINSFCSLYLLTPQSNSNPTFHRDDYSSWFQAHVSINTGSSLIIPPWLWQTTEDPDKSDKKKSVRIWPQCKQILIALTLTYSEAVLNNHIFKLTYEIHVCVSVIHVRFAQRLVAAGDDLIEELQSVLLAGDWRGRRFGSLYLWFNKKINGRTFCLWYRLLCVPGEMI